MCSMEALYASLRADPRLEEQSEKENSWILNLYLRLFPLGLQKKGLVITNSLWLWPQSRTH